jgi:hypothetical protein
LSGSTVPVRKRPESVKIVTCAPSAKRALCVPSGVTSSGRVLEPGDHAADRVGVHHHGPVRPAAPPGQGGVEQAAPGDRQVEAEVHQQLADVLHDLVGAARSGSASGAGG